MMCPEATETGTTPYGNAFTAWGGPTGGSIEWLRRGGSYGMNCGSTWSRPTARWTGCWCSRPAARA